MEIEQRHQNFRDGTEIKAETKPHFGSRLSRPAAPQVVAVAAVPVAAVVNPLT
jgi:hypothetical protein